jgi:multidrug resistance protein, MATE family
VRSAYRIELGAQLRLAAPLAIGHLGQQLMGIVDTAMLGRYSDQALAGAGIANGLLFAVTVVGIGTVMGLDALVPQALGAGQERRARRLLWHGIRVSFIIGVPLMAIAAATTGILSVVRVEPEVAHEARAYVLGRLPAIVPFLLATALRSYLQARDLTRPIIIATIAGNLVNVALDYVLIFGDPGLASAGLPGLGLPPLGVLGAAIATTVVSIVMMVVYALAVRRLHGEPTEPQRHDPVMTAAIVRIGAPVGLQLLAEVGIFAVTSVMAGRLGTVPAAAHQIAITLGSFTFSAAIGIGAAASVRVGRAVGAGDLAATRRAGGAALSMGALVMGSFGLVFLLAPRPLAALFSNDPEVVAAAVPLLRIAAVFQISDGVQAIAAGCLRGAGDTRATLWANLAGHYLVTLALAIYLAFGLGLGAPGLWWALSGGLTAVAILLLVRFRWLTARPISRA